MENEKSSIFVPPSQSQNANAPSIFDPRSNAPRAPLVEAPIPVKK
jgi:hypothetical protein